MALVLWKEANPAKPSRVAFAMSKLGSAHNLNGETALAESLLKQAVDIHRSLPAPDRVDFATSLDCLAKVYTYQRRFLEAEPLFQESLALISHTYNEHDPIYAISLQNLATMHRLAGNVARAEPLLRKAAAIYEENLGPRHPYLIMVWNEQGMIALGEKKNDVATAYMQKAYDLSAEVFGPMHLRTVFAKGNLALAYFRSGKLEKGQQMYMEVLDAERNSPQVAREEFARTLSNCGQIALILQQPKEAERFFGEAIPIWREVSLHHAPDLGGALSGYAQALRAARDPQARKAEKEVKAFLETQRH